MTMASIPLFLKKGFDNIIVKGYGYAMYMKLNMMKHEYPLFKQ